MDSRERLIDPGLRVPAAVMATAEVCLRGVRCRKDTNALYFEMRYPGRHGEGKLYSTKIESVKEGGLCYDIAQRYRELETGSGVGGKRKAALKLNYPDFSPNLQLESLPSDFDIECNKEKMMDIILKQAQAAAKNLPGSLERSTPVVGSQSPSNRRSSHQNAHSKLPRVAEVKQDLSGACTINEAQKLLQDISEHSDQCSRSLTSKVIERGELERKVADIKEDSGIICLPKPGPGNFYHHMACLKQLINRDKKVPWSPEQEYKSEESKCWELRKILRDHNSRSISGSLMADKNRMTGRQRADKNERLPEISPEDPVLFWNEFSYEDPVLFWNEH